MTSDPHTSDPHTSDPHKCDQLTTQEFYCSECSNYFLAVLYHGQTGYEALIICPNCKHEHQRCITNGQIHEQGRFQTRTTERILSTKATLSKTPRTHHHQTKLNYQDKRNGQPITPTEYDHWLKQSWLEKQAQEQGTNWNDDNPNA
jgi:hypothetical protein